MMNFIPRNEIIKISLLLYVTRGDTVLTSIQILARILRAHTINACMHNIHNEKHKLCMMYVIHAVCVLYDRMFHIVGNC